MKTANNLYSKIIDYSKVIEILKLHKGFCNLEIIKIKGGHLMKVYMREDPKNLQEISKKISFGNITVEKYEGSTSGIMVTYKYKI